MLELPNFGRITTYIIQYDKFFRNIMYRNHNVMTSVLKYPYLEKA